MKWPRVFLLSAALAVGARASMFAAEDCSKLEPGRANGNVPSCLAIDAATSTATGATVDTFGYRYVNAQIWSASASVATVQVECRSNVNAPWFACVNGGVSNPDSVGVYYSLPRAYQYRIRISSWTSGSVSASLERYQ